MVKAKKAFGQNFLQDSFYLDKIFQAIPETQNIALEIGPGLGDLTEKTLIKKSVVAIEIDTDLIPKLQARFQNEISNGKLRLVIGDAMTNWPQLQDYELIANLPYYVATPLTLQALKRPECKSICVLLQKEVAYKFAANAGDSDYGAISVLAAIFGTRKIVCDIPPEAFVPAPKIWSAFLRIDKNEKVDVSFDDFSKFLFVAFAQPRKTLTKNLAANYPKNKVLELLAELDLVVTTRPHEVSPTEYLKLYGQLH